jgi:hypothetical protein
MPNSDRPSHDADMRTASRLRRPWTLAALALAVALAWILALPSLPVVQPAVFNHARHRAVACATCHRGVETSARAGIPGVRDCLKCHATPPPGIAVAEWPAPDRTREIAWVQVTRLPDHVMFSHRRHVVIGRLACPSCHADIGERTSPPGAAPVRVDMNACLSCHRHEGASEDCAGCHR